MLVSNRYNCYQHFLFEACMNCTKISITNQLKWEVRIAILKNGAMRNYWKRSFTHDLPVCIPLTATQQRRRNSEGCGSIRYFPHNCTQPLLLAYDLSSYFTVMAYTLAGYIGLLR